METQAQSNASSTSQPCSNSSTLTHAEASAVAGETPTLMVTSEDCGGVDPDYVCRPCKR